MVLQIFVSEEGGTLDTALQANDRLINEDDSNCPDEYEEANLDCAVTAAVPLNNRVRVIVDELLNGATVEEFYCACYRADDTAQTDCPGRYASINASDCPNRPGTPVDETGSFLDVNADGVPDRAQILPGLVTVTCGSETFTTAPGNGFYNPSGNQQVPVGVIGGAIVPDVSKIGPAIVFTVAELPTSATCTLSVATSGTAFARDKDNLPLELPAGNTFTTAAFHALRSVPASGATGVALTVKPQVVFNAHVKDDQTSFDAITLRKKSDGSAVAGTAAFLVAASGAVSSTIIEFVPAAPLEPQTEYEVVVATTVTTRKDSKTSEAGLFTFKTGDAPAAP